MLTALLVAAFTQSIDSTPAHRPPRTIAIDERLAADAGIKIGDRIVVANTPGATGDTVVVAAITSRRADPSEVARAEYRALMHLDQLQSIVGYGDRVDRYAVATHGAAATDSAIRLLESPQILARRGNIVATGMAETAKS